MSLWPPSSSSNAVQQKSKGHGWQSLKLKFCFKGAPPFQTKNFEFGAFAGGKVCVFAKIKLPDFWLKFCCLQDEVLAKTLSSQKKLPAEVHVFHMHLWH
jgi:hypothetical protein